MVPKTRLLKSVVIVCPENVLQWLCERKQSFVSLLSFILQDVNESKCFCLEHLILQILNKKTFLNKMNGSTDLSILSMGIFWYWTRNIQSSGSAWGQCLKRWGSTYFLCECYLDSTTEPITQHFKILTSLNPWTKMVLSFGKYVHYYGIWHL